MTCLVSHGLLSLKHGIWALLATRAYREYSVSVLVFLIASLSLTTVTQVDSSPATGLASDLASDG